MGRQVRDTAKRSNGLLTGGPDVTWASTLHNLVAWLLLRIEAGIDRELLLRPTPTTAVFAQGVGDAVRPLDVQTLGALYLLARGRAAVRALDTSIRSWAT